MPKRSFGHPHLLPGVGESHEKQIVDRHDELQREALDYEVFHIARVDQELNPNMQKPRGHKNGGQKHQQCYDDPIQPCQAHDYERVGKPRRTLGNLDHTIAFRNNRDHPHMAAEVTDVPDFLHDASAPKEDHEHDEVRNA